MAHKITIELTDDEMATLQRASESRGAGTEELARDAVAAVIRRLRDEEADAAYAEAYRKQPQTEEELAVVRSASKDFWQHLDREYPWDPDGAR